jgi:serine/threonine-protein kinase
MLKQVEKYAIVDEIGHGGMATVYRARDTRLDRLVALKVMHPHLQGTEEARQRFAREALTVARLRHPSILEIYDYSGEDSEISFIATELLTGPTLKVFCDAHRDIPPEIAACMALQVARALGAAHAEGVVHRDVKPENVMLHENRCVKLTDFGIAQLVDVQGMTTTGQVLGSPAHMAPEQIEGRDCDARTDLFSLGTVLYLLATAELPFTGSNPHQLLKRIMDGEFRDPLQVRPAIGNRLAAIIRKLLELAPVDRYQSATELERDLTAFVAEMGMDAPDEALAQYLAEPAGFPAAFRTRCIERLIELGERAQKRGERPLALDYYNRVLALDDGNDRVLNAVQRLGRRSALRRVVLRGGAAVSVLALVAAGIYVAVRPPASRAADAAHKPAVSLPASRTVAAARRPATTPARPATPRIPVTNVRVPTLKPPRDGVRVHPRGNGTAGTAVMAGTGPRMVTFNPFPANVSIGVNGATPREFGPSFREIELEPGTHRFKFVGAHDCCIDEEFSVKVPPGTGTFTVTRRLKFRPAGLYVVTPTPANVFVDDGRISGRTRSVIQVPDLSDLVETHRIRVAAEGHRDHVQEVRLQAGQVVTVQVDLPKSSEDS